MIKANNPYQGVSRMLIEIIINFDPSIQHIKPTVGNRVIGGESSKWLHGFSNFGILFPS